MPNGTASLIACLVWRENGQTLGVSNLYYFMHAFYLLPFAYGYKCKLDISERFSPAKDE